MTDVWDQLLKASEAAFPAASISADVAHGTRVTTLEDGKLSFH